MILDLLREKSPVDCWMVICYLFFFPCAVRGKFWLTSLVLLIYVKTEIRCFLFMLSGTKVYVIQMGWSDNKGQYVCQYFLSTSFSYVNGE